MPVPDVLSAYSLFVFCSISFEMRLTNMFFFYNNSTLDLYGEYSKTHNKATTTKQRKTKQRKQ